MGKTDKGLRNRKNSLRGIASSPYVPEPKENGRVLAVPPRVCLCCVEDLREETFDLLGCFSRGYMAAKPLGWPRWTQGPEGSCERYVHA